MLNPSPGLHRHLHLLHAHLGRRQSEACPGNKHLQFSSRRRVLAGIRILVAGFRGRQFLLQLGVLLLRHQRAPDGDGDGNVNIDELHCDHYTLHFHLHHRRIGADRDDCVDFVHYAIRPVCRE